MVWNLNLFRDCFGLSLPLSPLTIVWGSVLPNFWVLAAVSVDYCLGQSAVFRFRPLSGVGFWAAVAVDYCLGQRAVKMSCHRGLLSGAVEFGIFGLWRLSPLTIVWGSAPRNLFWPLSPSTIVWGSVP